jgi:tight adherence protein C
MLEGAVVLTFLAVLFLVYSLSLRRTDLIEARLEAVKSGLRPRQATMSQPFLNRVVAPAILGLERLLLKLVPITWIKATSQRLVWAGSPMSIDAFVLIWAASLVIFPLLVFRFAEDFGVTGLTRVIAIGGGLALGAYAPQYWLSSRIANRHYLTRKELPDALDLMVTSVEAGLSLDAALMRVAEYHTGPLQRELSQALEDMTLGQSRRNALDAMAQRMNLPELTSFIQAVNQAEVTGAPIGQILRTQAEQVRLARRQTAEAQAQRAPLLMIIPLVCLIFPSLFVVLLGPALLTIVDILQNSDLFNR